MNPADPSSERRSSPRETQSGPASGNTPPLALLSHARTSNDSPAQPAPEKEKMPKEKEREDFEPQYLEVPKPRRGSRGGRNLVWGVLTLLIAAALLFQAIAMLGARAALPLGTALLTFVALFVLARSRVLRQRNGGFVALAVVSLLAALIPLAEYGVNRGSSASGTSPVSQKFSVVEGTVAAASDDLPLLTDIYKMPAADEKTARFKVLRDLRVIIPHLIKAGQTFPVSEAGEKEVRFAAGDQQIALPKEYVELLKSEAETPAQSVEDQPLVAAAPTPDSKAPDSAEMPAADPAATPESALPADETPSQITQRAQKEAIRRYPALGEKDSAENQLFIETYKELKFSGADDFFVDPQWPLQLAELLAKRENWQRVP